VTQEVVRAVAGEYGWPGFSVQPQAVTVPEIDLQTFAGTYELRQDSKQQVILRDGSLMLEANGQPAVPLTPCSTTRFFAHVLNLEIEFQTGDKGSVMGLVLHQGGKVTPAAR
jgi:Domain of unknown function (DUF3471)